MPGWSSPLGAIEEFPLLREISRSSQKVLGQMLWGVRVALTAAGSTTHYRISYDDSLSAADGSQRATALLGVCEQDYVIMSDWFGGIALPYSLPIEVHIDPGGYASAGWGPPISLKPGNGSGLDVVRYLLVAEVVEMLMLARDQAQNLPENKGWFASDGSNEGSEGEGVRLSKRFLISGCFGHAARLRRSMVSWS